MRPLSCACVQVSGFFADIEQDPHACAPDILLVYEVFTEEQATMLYPFNLLRNLARLQVPWCSTYRMAPALAIDGLLPTYVHWQLFH